MAASSKVIATWTTTGDEESPVVGRVVFVGGKPGNFPLTGSGGMETGRGGKGEREGWGDHLSYFPPPLASASNTTLVVGYTFQTLRY